MTAAATRPTSRALRVGALCLAQLALVGLAVAGPLSARATGEEYLLEVAPVDPVDPFRGAYVDLGYPTLSRQGLPPQGEVPEPEVQPAAGEPGEVFIPLVRDGELWRGGTATRQRPATGPYLRCSDRDWRLRCGIESYFLPQQRAVALERAVASGDAVARIKVDRRGNAALVDVEVSPAG